MPNSYFQFKQFTIHQEHAAMKVGTDGVLLGAWAPNEDAHSVLDIGSGTGLITLMMAQRTQSHIVGLEIDELAYKDSIFNVKQSHWEEQITIIHDSLQNYASNSNEHYDCIVSNPPFFQDSLKSENTSRNFARHTDSLSFQDLFESVSKLLSDTGTFSLIIPSSDAGSCLNIAKNLKLFPQRILQVKPTPRHEPKRTLICFGREIIALLEEEIVIEDKGRHQYSGAYKELTKDFYLKF